RSREAIGGCCSPKKGKQSFLRRCNGNHEEHELEHHYPRRPTNPRGSCRGAGSQKPGKPLQRNVAMKTKSMADAGVALLEPHCGEAQTPTPSLLSAPVFRLQKILVPVDFSDCSKKALHYALPFAKHFSAELVLLHVVEPYPFVPEMGPYDMENINDGRQELQA